MYIKRWVIVWDLGFQDWYFVTRQVRWILTTNPWPKCTHTLNIGSYRHLPTIYRICGMWKPLLTYGLLTVTVTGLTVFNLVTWPAPIVSYRYFFSTPWSNEIYKSNKNALVAEIYVHKFSNVMRKMVWFPSLPKLNFSNFVDLRGNLACGPFLLVFRLFKMVGLYLPLAFLILYRKVQHHI